MNLRVLRNVNDEPYAFVPDFNSPVTALPPDAASHPCAVASRPDHPPHLDPAGTVHPCQREL